MLSLKNYQVIGLVVILVVVLRSPTLFESMYLVDEGYSGAVATEMMYGGKIYQSVVETRAPFIYYVYYGVFRIAGQNNLFAIHVLAIAVVILTACVVREIGTVVADASSGDWAAVGYVVFSHTFLPRDTLAANIEIFTLLPLTLVWLCVLLGENRRRSAWLFTGGMLCGISIFFRQTSVESLGVMSAYLLYAWAVARSKTLRQAMTAGGVYLAGLFVSLGVIIVFFQAQGVWEDIIRWTWVIAMRYVNSETTLPYVLRRILLVHGTFILAGGLLWYFGAMQFMTTVREHMKRCAARPEPMLIVFWCAATYVTLFAGWRFPGHYHLMIIPPLAVLAGMAFTRFLIRLKTATPSKARRIRCMLGTAAALPALTFLITAFVIREQTLAFTPITEYITAQTRSDDRIFVWGSAPHIYSFSGRRMASRFASCTHLVGMYASRPHRDIDESKWIVPGSWEGLRTDLTSHPPELIVDMSSVLSNWDVHPIAKYPFLREYLKAYRLEQTVIGAKIYRRIS